MIIGQAEAMLSFTENLEWQEASHRVLIKAAELAAFHQQTCRKTGRELRKTFVQERVAHAYVRKLAHATDLAQITVGQCHTQIKVHHPLEFVADPWRCVDAANEVL